MRKYILRGVCEPKPDSFLMTGIMEERSDWVQLAGAAFGYCKPREQGCSHAHHVAPTMHAVLVPRVRMHVHPVHDDLVTMVSNDTATVRQLRQRRVCYSLLSRVVVKAVVDPCRA